MGKNPKIVQCLLQTLKIITYVYFLKSGREAEMGRKISVFKNVDFSLYCIIFFDFLAPCASPDEKQPRPQMEL